jgi:putative flippase GtrA
MNDRARPAARTWRALAARLREKHAREIAVFLAVGVSNTVLTYAVYYGLLHLVHYKWAYTGSFLVGLLFTGLLNIRVTFAHHPTLLAWIAFAAYYTAYYLINLALLHLLIEGLSIDQRLGPLVLLPIVVPINFVMMRLIIHRFARARS